MRAGGLVIGFIHQPWRLAPESLCRQLARRRDLQQDLRGQLRDQRPRQGPSLCLSPWARTRVLYKRQVVKLNQIKAGEIIYAPAAAGSAGAGVASELEVSSAAGEAAAAGSLSAAGAASALLVSAAAAGAASVASSLDPFVSRAVILDCSED